MGPWQGRMQGGGAKRTNALPNFQKGNQKMEEKGEKREDDEREEEKRRKKPKLVSLSIISYFSLIFPSVLKPISQSKLCTMYIYTIYKCTLNIHYSYTLKKF